HIAIVERTAEEAGRYHLAFLPARPAVQLRTRGNVIPRIEEYGFLVHVGLAVPRVEAIDAPLARIERPTDARILLPRIEPVRFGALLILVFGTDRQEASLSECEAFPCRGDERVAIRDVALHVGRRHGPVRTRGRRRRRRRIAGIPAAVGQTDIASLIVVAQP